MGEGVPPRRLFRRCASRLIQPAVDPELTSANTLFEIYVRNNFSVLFAINLLSPYRHLSNKVPCLLGLIPGRLVMSLKYTIAGCPNDWLHDRGPPFFAKHRLCPGCKEVKTAMKRFSKSKAEKLGPPKIGGTGDRCGQAGARHLLRGRPSRTTTLPWLMRS